MDDQYEQFFKFVLESDSKCGKTVSEEGGSVCPAEFDGIVCWESTNAGETAVSACPAFASNSSVTRRCEEDGRWDEIRPIDYTVCKVKPQIVQDLRNQLRTLPDVSKKLLRRILQEKQLCETMKSTTRPPDGDDAYCPIAFDGYACWNYTLAGTTAYMKCPSYIDGFDKRLFAFKVCLENGSWFRHPESNDEWSNYTTCIDVEDLNFRNLVNTLYITGYTISFVALVLSLLIFFSFRSLKCTRIAIHVQLFLSFAANNLMWIVWYRQVVPDPLVLHQNQAWCQVLHVCLQYLMVANYMWMFCEGLHLHLALVVVFVKDELVMRWFYFVGWGLPLIVTCAYATCRLSRKNETEKCWMGESATQWILGVPVCVSMLANLVFLINVVRVLLTKLHSNSTNPAPVGMRKAVRATLILVPLFGLHHILIPFRPEPQQPGERVYQVFSAIVVSLQGLCVSCLFCFANVDVHGAVRPLVRRVCPWVARGGPPQVNTHTQSRDVCV